MYTKCVMKIPNICIFFSKVFDYALCEFVFLHIFLGVSVTNMNPNRIQRTLNLSHTTAHQPQPRTCQWSEESLGSCAPADQSINSSTSIKSIQSMDSRMNMYAHHVHILSFWTLKTWSMIGSPAKTVMMCNCHCQQNSRRNHLLYEIFKIVHSLPEGWRIGFDTANERA